MHIFIVSQPKAGFYLLFFANIINDISISLDTKGQCSQVSFSPSTNSLHLPIFVTEIFSSWSCLTTLGLLLTIFFDSNIFNVSPNPIKSFKHLRKLSHPV